MNHSFDELMDRLERKRPKPVRTACEWPRCAALFHQRFAIWRTRFDRTL